MLEGLDVDQMEYVVELGPGTGCFTQELYDRLPAACQVLVIELEALIAERGWPRVDLVLSGLPFVLPKPVKESLWASLKRFTGEGTVYRFFTYMPPVMKRHYRDFDLRLVRGVAANLPPMWIYSVN